MRAKTLRRAVTIGAVSLCFWAARPTNASACECVRTTVCDARHSEAVFVGRVIAFTSDVQFEVERALVGVKRGKITIENSRSNCAYRFTIGERYIVYASRESAAGALTTSKCSRTRPLSDPYAQFDLAYLERGRHRGASRPIIIGLVSDATIDLATPGPVRPRPLAGITIAATRLDGGRRHTTRTGADGGYELTGIGTGEFRIEAMLPPQFESSQPQTVMVDDAHRCAEFHVAARIDGRISGQLLDERGEPLAGVPIQLANPAPVRAAVSLLRTLDAFTRAQGRFEFLGVGPGEYVVGVSLQTPLRPGKLNTRRFYGGGVDPRGAVVVAIDTAERRQLPPFRLPPLPADRVITIVVQAPTSDVAREATLFVRGATREPLARTDDPLALRLPFGTSYRIEAVAPKGYRITQPASIVIAADDTDRVIEFRVETP